MINIRRGKNFVHYRDMIEISAKPAADIIIPVDGVNWSERYCTLPDDFEKAIDNIYNFTVRDDDVFVVTMPKCGTTWMQEAAWIILNDLDYTKATSVDLRERSIFMDLSGLYSSVPMDTVRAAAQMSSPRLIKTHLPANLIPKEIWQKKTKLIYVARNAKDVVVSFYHFHKGLGTWYGGEIETFTDDFIQANLMYTPFWPHVIDFWQMRNQSNIFFTTYEAMKWNLPAVLQDLSIFLGKRQLVNDEIHRLVDHLSFESMKASPRTNPTSAIKTGPDSEIVLPEFEFMRRGDVGSYKDELPEESRQKIDLWTEKCLKGFNVRPSDILGIFQAKREQNQIC